jgi:hypothetical protein
VTLKFCDWIIVLFFGCLVFFHFRGIDLAAGRDSCDEDVFDNKLLLFILDFQDFSCMTCLDSFLGLYRQLPARFKTSKTWGILVVKKSEKEENKQLWIAEKKLRGFIRANRIMSPILMDRSHFFEGLVEEGSGVLLFDGIRNSVHRYAFPLAGSQFEEIFEIINR